MAGLIGCFGDAGDERIELGSGRAWSISCVLSVGGMACGALMLFKFGKEGLGSCEALLEFFAVTQFKWRRIEMLGRA